MAQSDHKGPALQCLACKVSEMRVETRPEVRLDGAQILFAVGTSKGHTIACTMTACAALEIIDALVAAVQALPAHVIESTLAGRGSPTPYLPRPVGYGMDAQQNSGGCLAHWASCPKRPARLADARLRAAPDAGGEEE